MYAFFFEYRKQVYAKYAGLFNGATDEDAEKTDNTYNWFGFFYAMAKGCPVKMSEILELNFIYLLNFKSYETKHKKIATYYDYGRYNIEQWATAK